MLKTLIRLFIVSLFYSSAQAQFEKSLLWEISGNGLQKKSYVYGTFHVSEKISYHLSDAFYQHLLNADIVSNESNPETWDVLFDLALGESNLNRRSPRLFSENLLKGADKQKIPGLFANMNYFSNMTSGNDGEAADYRENTVLDMFIFQTAKKYNKKIVGLEDAKESYLALTRYEKTNRFDEDETEENSEEAEEKRALLAKIVKNKTPYVALKDFYREKDIVMLDSLSKLSDGPKKHKILIIDRNYIMAKSIDSLAQRGSLFSAIGAAHLAGKEGVLQLLKDKGYTVKPVMGPLTPKGEAQKKVLEELYVTPKTKPSTSTDGMIQSVSFDLDLEFGPMKSSLDISNGGVLNITRLPLNDFMVKRKDQFNPKTIDSLLYEFIPGTILEKKEFREEAFVGYDVRNKSKTGNYQHFRFYVTPLEIISVCMVGPNDYVKKFEQSIYDRIKVRGFGKNWTTVTPTKGGFSVNLPEYCVQYGNSDKFDSNIVFQAYDPNEKGYYFVLEQTQNDVDILDDEVFQHGRLHNEFYMNHELKETAEFDKMTTLFESATENESHQYRLKSVIQGNKYYLLGAVDSSIENTRKFFDSFISVPFRMQKTIVHRDTLCKFSVEIPEKVNESKILGTSRTEMSRFRIKNKGENRINTTFASHSGQNITIKEEYIGRYNQLSSIDSLRVNTLKFLEYEQDGYENDSIVTDNPLRSQWDKYFKKKKKSTVTLLDFKYDTLQKVHILDAMITRPGVKQAIKTRVLTNKNRQVILKTVVDKSYTNTDAFIEKVFQSFTMEPNEGAGLQEDKVQLFLNEARSETDSIRKLAFENIFSLSLKESDFDRIKDFLDVFPFKDQEIRGKSRLYAELSRLKNPAVATYLESKYKQEGVKSIEQLTILNALASLETEQAFKTILKLMEYDLPVSEDGSEIQELFYRFRKRPEISKVLFPDIFQFYGIEEYNKPIILLCNELLEKKLGAPKKIAAFQKIILTHSKLEYKRMVNRQEKKAANSDEDSEEYEDYVVETVDENEERESQYSDLINYISLLYHLPSNKSVDELLEIMKKIDDPALQLEIIQLEIKHNKTTKERLQNALDNTKSKFNTILLLNQNDEYKLLENISDDAIAEAAMLYFDKVGSKDKIQFLENRTTNHNGHEIVFYFYQTQPMKDGKPSGSKVFHAMAYVVQNGKLLPQVYKSPVVEDIDEENTVEKLIPIVMNETLYGDHPMSNYRKENNTYNSFLEYED